MVANISKLVANGVAYNHAGLTNRHRQIIEASFREAIPEIGNIIDATDHAAGDNPYFAGSKK